jgi:hypothetical protein
MWNWRLYLLFLGVLMASARETQAQDPQRLIQRIVDQEYAAYQTEHTNWVFLDQTRNPKHHDVRWVVQTPEGEVQRLVEEDDRRIALSKQQELIRNFVQDREAQKKQIGEIDHDRKQIIDLMRLLPSGFVWKETNRTATVVCFHFEPAPHFHPPTREARVMSGMAGDLVADAQQNRILSVQGHLIHDVNFGGGILGKLRQGSFFSIEQDQVGPSLWQLKAVHVHMSGNALLFKSVALEEDDDRCNFELQRPKLTLGEAAEIVMNKPGSPQFPQPVASNHW